MIRSVLLDTGPLVALVNPRDAWFQTCRDCSAEIEPPLITSWAVLAEAVWLLRKVPPVVEKLFALCRAGFLEVPPIESQAFPRLLKLFQTYREHRPDLTLIYLAEKLAINTIFTLDRRDFAIYRIGRNREFHILPA